MCSYISENLQNESENQNKELELCCKSWLLIAEEVDNKYMIKETDLLKVFDLDATIQIYFKRKIEKLSCQIIMNLDNIFIYCLALKCSDTILSAKILKELSDIYEFVLQ